jgi:hypothetical protein
VDCGRPELLAKNATLITNNKGTVAVCFHQEFMASTIIDFLRHAKFAPIPFIGLIALKSKMSSIFFISIKLISFKAFHFRNVVF